MSQPLREGYFYKYGGSPATGHSHGDEISWTEARARIGSGKDVFTLKQQDAQKLAGQVIPKPGAWQWIEESDSKGYFRSFAPQKYGEIYYGRR